MNKHKSEDKKRHLEKEIKHLHIYFETARDLHVQLYDFVEEDEYPLNQWEHELTDDVFSIEEVQMLFLVKRIQQ